MKGCAKSHCPSVIGITGGIGSGKSVVSQLLGVMGYSVFDSDKEAKLLMNQDEELKQSLCDAFGSQTYHNGLLNRDFLASVIFSEKQALHRINALVHPAVGNWFKRWAASQKGNLVFFECAILFESGFETLADQIWTVSAPLEVRIERAIARDHSTREKIVERIKSQMSQEEKELRSDSIIYNDDVLPLIPQVERLLDKLQ